MCLSNHCFVNTYTLCNVNRLEIVNVLRQKQSNLVLSVHRLAFFLSFHGFRKTNQIVHLNQRDPVVTFGSGEMYSIDKNCRRNWIKVTIFSQNQLKAAHFGTLQLGVVKNSFWSLFGSWKELSMTDPVILIFYTVCGKKNIVLQILKILPEIVQFLVISLNHF